jgi:hypothetical protein
MNGSGNQSLAGARLPVQHDGGIAPGNLFNNSEDLAHGGALPDDVFEYDLGLSFDRNNLIGKPQI